MAGNTSPSEQQRPRDDERKHETDLDVLATALTDSHFVESLKQGIADVEAGRVVELTESDFDEGPSSVPKK